MLKKPTTNNAPVPVEPDAGSNKARRRVAREARLAAALRDNLRRRKAAVDAVTKSLDPGEA